MPTKKKEPAAKKIAYPELKIGAKGELVIQLQDLLSKSGSKIKINGKFTIGTYAAVVAFQRKNGLVPDGVVGKKTWAKLVKVK